MREFTWNLEQINFLIENYRHIGDQELAELYEEKWPKSIKWKKNQIVKKRKYLNLHRSADEIKRIRSRNTESGRFVVGAVKRWKAEAAPEGTVKFHYEKSGNPIPVIKVGKRFKHWSRVMYERTYGPIPEKMSVIFKNGDSSDLRPENLEIQPEKDRARSIALKNITGLSDNWVAGIMSRGNEKMKEVLLKTPELLELKKNQLKLKRLVEHERKQTTPDNK